MFLRELLQNALDACRYQKARAQEAAMADKYVPRIQVWDGSTAPRDPNKPNGDPRIIFQDNGIGMSLNQVENFFMRVGKSFYRSAEFNAERERLAAKGIHLDACSQFGIGFLSCFLGGDRIEVETYQHGSEPLKITIEGPRKYFLIERLRRPENVGIPFNSPSDPADDSPPQHAGTKITVFLRDGWRKNSSEADSDLAFTTLDAVAVNQEIPITVTGRANSTPRELAPSPTSAAVEFVAL
jgi:HSP90 family molecular chaperone